MSTSYYQTQPTGSLPISVPGKSPQHGYNVRHHARNSSAYSQLSASPPERPESVSSSGAGLYSAPTSSYAGSTSDYDSPSGAANVDLLDYMSGRLSQAYDPNPMDRNLAKQAQMSGQLNAKNRELLTLQAEAKARLAKTRANFADGMKAAKEVQRDLEWTQKKVHAINQRAAYKYPEQYRAANQRYPAPVDC
ncbi:hypothetical protein MBLNU230_g8644t1 [Neophaeotheca triangularis]